MLRSLQKAMLYELREGMARLLSLAASLEAAAGRGAHTFVQRNSLTFHDLTQDSCDGCLSQCS